MNTIRYQQQMHDAPRTMEQQLYLVTQQANMLAKAALTLLTKVGFEHSSAHKDLTSQTQRMNCLIQETDVYMAGYQEKP